MKKNLLALAALVLIFAACQNTNSSTVGEKDEEYSQTFHTDSTGHDGNHEEKH